VLVCKYRKEASGSKYSPDATIFHRDRPEGLLKIIKKISYPFLSTVPSV
jgi:hypothetical protein